MFDFEVWPPAARQYTGLCQGQSRHTVVLLVNAQSQNSALITASCLRSQGILSSTFIVASWFDLHSMLNITYASLLTWPSGNRTGICNVLSLYGFMSCGISLSLLHIVDTEPVRAAEQASRLVS